jgi:hypothetical protein
MTTELSFNSQVNLFRIYDKLSSNSDIISMSTNCEFFPNKYKLLCLLQLEMWQPDNSVHVEVWEWGKTRKCWTCQETGLQGVWWSAVSRKFVHFTAAPDMSLNFQHLPAAEIENYVTITTEKL